MIAYYYMFVKCHRCASELKQGKLWCTSCKTWNVENNASITSGGKLIKDGSILLEDIQSADSDRIETGPWDPCFGTEVKENGDLGISGIVRGSVNLIGGSPGAGKSTLFLQLSESVIKKYKQEVLYISGEEQLPQIRARANRLKIKGDRKLRFIDVRKGDFDISAILRSYTFGLIIVDSLKAISGDDDSESIALCKIIKEFASLKHAPAVISHHVTKDQAIAGLMGLQHEVDMTATFFPDDELISTDPETGMVEAIRFMQTIKNRNGNAFVEIPFQMTARGLIKANLNEDGEIDEEEYEEE